MLARSPYILSEQSVTQDVSVSWQPRIEVFQDLVCFLHRPLLDPRLDLLLIRKSQHSFYLRWTANQTASNLDTLGNERER